MRSVVLVTMLIAVGCATPVPTPAPELPAEPITLTIKHWPFTYSREALDAVVELHGAQHSNVRIKVVELEIAPEATAVDAEGLYEGADLLITHESTARRMDTGPLLADLAGTHWPELDPKVEQLMESFSITSGRRSFLPLRLDPMCIAADTQAFADAGIPLPDMNWSYTDLEQTLRQVKAAGLHTTVYMPLMLQPTMAAFGGGGWDQSAGRWRFDRPENRQALNFLQRLYAEGLLLKQSGTVASPALVSTTCDRFRRDYSPAPYPVGPAGRFSMVNPSGLVMLKQSAHPEEARAFVQTLLSEAGQRVVAGAGVRPITLDQEALEMWREEVGDKTADILEAALDGAYWPEQPRDWFSVQKELRAVVEGTASLDEVLPRLDEQLNPAQ